jgi:RNA polymerase sigma-70 factor (ECF subfamily)
LARARSTMAGIDPTTRGRALDDGDRSLLDKYVAAFEAYDVKALVALLAEDAVFSMPPYTFWLRGTEDIEAWYRGPGEVCKGSRMVLTRANGGPAVAAYHQADSGRWEPFALHLLDVRDGRVAGICHFLDTSRFADFGLPAELTA